MKASPAPSSSSQTSPASQASPTPQTSPTPQRSSSGTSATATVPNVAGMDETGAISTLEQAGFRIYWVYRCLNSTPIGDVGSQSPTAGSSYPAGKTVSIELQASNCPATVPNVAGMDLTMATSTLEQAGFRIYWAYQCLNSTPTGEVGSQSPAAGSSYLTGQTVSVLLQASNC